MAKINICSWEKNNAFFLTFQQQRNFSHKNIKIFWWIFQVEIHLKGHNHNIPESYRSSPETNRIGRMQMFTRVSERFNSICISKRETLLLVDILVLGSIVPLCFRNRIENVLMKCCFIVFITNITKIVWIQQDFVTYRDYTAIW